MPIQSPFVMRYRPCWSRRCQVRDTATENRNSGRRQLADRSTALLAQLPDTLVIVGKTRGVKTVFTYTTLLGHMSSCCLKCSGSSHPLAPLQSFNTQKAQIVTILNIGTICTSEYWVSVPVPLFPFSDLVPFVQLARLSRSCLLKPD